MCTRDTESMNQLREFIKIILFVVFLAVVMGFMKLLLTGCTPAHAYKAKELPNRVIDR